MAERTATRRPAPQGRRPGNPDTKQSILLAARKLFAANGYTNTSMRQIAAAAKVDAALIHHYFTTKEQLFLATVEISVDIPGAIAGVLAGDPATFGPRLVRTFLSVWDSDAGASLVVAFRAAIADPLTSGMVRDFISTAVLGGIAGAAHLATDDVPRRLTLIASQMVGLAVTRYLLALQPLAGLPADDVVQAIGPTIQRYLTGPLS